MDNEKRKFTRRDLEDLSAKLYNPLDGHDIDFCPINVSQQGLSVLTSNPLPLNTALILALGKKDVHLIVRWCKPKENDLALFRCGLEAIHPEDHLDELIKEELSY